MTTPQSPESLVDEAARKECLHLPYNPELSSEYFAFKRGVTWTLKNHPAVLAMREALAKYANPQNWRYSSNNDVGAHDAWLDFKPGHYSKTYNDLGIYIAKEAITQHDKAIKGE